MEGTIAVTDYGWYDFLLRRRPPEVNFWTPSDHRAFHASSFSPFFFKLKAPHNAIGGFGYSGPVAERLRTSSDDSVELRSDLNEGPLDPRHLSAPVLRRASLVHPPPYCASTAPRHTSDPPTPPAPFLPATRT